MHCFQSTYELRRLESMDTVFTDALKIYTRSTPPSMRTLTNEIMYWAPRYKSVLKDDLFLFALLRNEEVIGFAEITYFNVEKLLVLDYMAIDPHSRGHNAFFEFLNLISIYLEKENVDFSFAVAEIGNCSITQEPCEEGRKLIRLLKLAGFGVIKAPYAQPPLDLGNPETQMPAILMVLRNDAISCLKKETYLGIVHTIFYKHYLRWYEPFPYIDMTEYRKRIDKLFADISSMPGKEVKINGSWHGIENLHPIIRETKPPLRGAGIFVVLTLGVFLVLCWAQFFSRFRTQDIVLLVFMSLVIVLAVTAIFTRRSLAIFGKVIEVVTKLVGKK